MTGMDAVFAWMTRPEVVLAASITAIVLNLIGLAFTITQEQRRG